MGRNEVKNKIFRATYHRGIRERDVVEFLAAKDLEVAKVGASERATETGWLLISVKEEPIDMEDPEDVQKVLIARLVV